MRKLFLLAATLSLYACAESAVPAPDYEEPMSGPAFKAYKAAMKTDWLDQPYELGEPPESANAMNYQQSVEWNEKQLANKKAPKVYKALQKLQINACEWGAVRNRDLPERVRERVPTPPFGAYRCKFTLHYRINPPFGDPYEVESEGMFYQQDYAYIYAGKFAHPY